MIEPLFVIPIFKYECLDWKNKKKKTLNELEKLFFKRSPLKSFSSTREKNQKEIIPFFIDTFKEEIESFAKELGVNTVEVTDVWSVNYNKNGYQEPHNHRSYSYSGILYLKYDHRVHHPTTFICPWNDPVLDKTILQPIKNVKEGSIVFFPSFLLHYAPQNKSFKNRSIVSFDLIVK